MKKGKAKPTGEFPECVPFCPTMRTIREAQASCESCELRSKKASEIKLEMKGGLTAMGEKREDTCPKCGGTKFTDQEYGDTQTCDWCKNVRWKPRPEVEKPEDDYDDIRRQEQYEEELEK